MNLKEFDEFRTADAVKFNRQLNPALFDSDDNLRLEVRVQLLEIAEDFMQHLGVSGIQVKDITLSGSNAAYTYTKHSDIDLHIIVDIEALRCDDIYRELFTSKKTVYNDTHDIKIRGYDVELYVQDSAQKHHSLGEYSVLKGKWIKFPSKRRANFDEFAAREKFKKLIQLSELALRGNDLRQLENLLATISKYRKAGLDKHGEFGAENLAYKSLRSRGIVDKLYQHRNNLHSKSLSLQERGRTVQADEDYDPNGPPPGPEFKPTMPQGTVKVDVSDVYDWYKLGQHVSNLKGLGHHDFGKGPPSTIMSFGSEDEEHKYIDYLEKTGLSTTDIDPVDPKRPKGVKRQKVDPTYNVGDEVVGLKEAVHFLKPGELRGSYTDSEMVAKGFRKSKNGTWFINQKKWDEMKLHGKETGIKPTNESASGYIPSESERNDPRFKMGLSVDVKPDSIKRNAKKLGLGNIHRSGVPPTARSDGKIR